MRLALVAPARRGLRAGNPRAIPGIASLLLVAASSACLWWLVLWTAATVL